jgi:hypothetical protein
VIVVIVVIAEVFRVETGFICTRPRVAFLPPACAGRRRVIYFVGSRGA